MTMRIMTMKTGITITNATVTEPVKNSPIRLHSGIAGDMFLCGLMCMLGMNNEEADAVLNGIFSELKGSVHLEDKFVGGIRGSFCRVELLTNMNIVASPTSAPSLKKLK
ncbi:MAG: hypothetical protein ACLRRK_03325 [Parasutterella sp.]